MKRERVRRRAAHRRRRHARRGSIGIGLVFALAISLLGTGTWLLTRGITSTTYSPPPAAPLPSRTYSLPAGSPLPAPEPAPATCRDELNPANLAANHIAIPTLCVDAPLVSVGLEQDGSALTIPADLTVGGRWSGGAALDPADISSEARGTSLIAAHVNYNGAAGIFAGLARIEPGAAIYTTDSSRKVTVWQVNRLQVVIKAALPAEIFHGEIGARQLVLATCGGPVTYVPGYGNSYQDNVIVYAVPVSGDE